MNLLQLTSAPVMRAALQGDYAQAYENLPLDQRTPLLAERKYCADKYSIRVFQYGYRLANGQRTTLRVWWSCLRLADEHAREWQRVHEHMATQLENGEITGYWIVEVYDGC